MADQPYYKDPLLSQQPESDKNPASSMQHIVRKALMSICDVCLPAEVLSYDRVKGRAVVRGLIQRVTVDDKIAQRQPLYDIPLTALGDSDFYISFPIVVGTKGWLLVCDRDIELYKKSLKESRPNTYRAHSFQDSWFLPDHQNPMTINGEDAAAVVIQHKSSNTRIAIAADAIRLTVGGSKVTIVDGTITVDTTTLVVNAKNTNVNGALTVTGQTTLEGGLHSTGGGANNLEGPTTIEGVDFLPHTHPDNHGGNTGPVNQ